MITTVLFKQEKTILVSLNLLPANIREKVLELINTKLKGGDICDLDELQKLLNEFGYKAYWSSTSKVEIVVGLEND